MTSIPTGAASAWANVQSLRSMLGDVKFIDIKNVSAVSAASDFAFNVADADKDASLSVDEFMALGKKGSSDANAQALFAAMDKDTDGKLNSHEVRASGLLSPGNIQALLGIDDIGSWMVSQADGDGDGGLTYDEYTNSRGAGPVKATFVGPNGEKTELSGMRLDALQSVFNAMDGDGDGRLSASELGEHLQAAEGYAQYNPSSGSERMSDDLVSRNDADGDGALSAEELTRAAEAPTYEGEGDPAAGVNAMMGVADGNRDGKISSEEFAALATKRLSMIDYFSQSESATDEAASRLMLSRLMRSTFAQLRNDFVAPSAATDITA